MNAHIIFTYNIRSILTDPNYKIEHRQSCNLDDKTKIILMTEVTYYVALLTMYHIDEINRLLIVEMIIM